MLPWKKMGENAFIASPPYLTVSVMVSNSIRSDRTVLTWGQYGWSKMFSIRNDRTGITWEQSVEVKFSPIWFGVTSLPPRCHYINISPEFFSPWGICHWCYPGLRSSSLGRTLYIPVAEEAAEAPVLGNASFTYKTESVTPLHYMELHFHNINVTIHLFSHLVSA